MKPLTDIKVLDLSRVLAGPWATQVLSDLGAEVIKIEDPKGGDMTRHWGPPFDESGRSAYFLSANRGKHSRRLDFTKDADISEIHRLVSQVDVVVENFLPGKLKKFRLDYESLKAINPKIIYCSITGFGQDGPMSQEPGFDYMIQAMGGLMSITGEAEELAGCEPMRVGVPIVDLMTGVYAANGIQAALIKKLRTDEGSYIDIALLDVQMAMLANQGMNYLVSNKIPKRIGNCHPNIVPYQLFQCVDAPIVIAVGNDKQFVRFCDGIGASHLAQDNRFVTNQGRVEHRRELVASLKSLVSSFKRNELLELLKKSNIPCAPVNTIAEAFQMPQLLHRKVVKEVGTGEGKAVVIGSPFHFDGENLTSEFFIGK